VRERESACVCVREKESLRRLKDIFEFDAMRCIHLSIHMNIYIFTVGALGACNVAGFYVGDTIMYMII